MSLKLYRVRKPADLIGAAATIGRDFIFRDYGLQHAHFRNAFLRERLRRLSRASRLLYRIEERTRPPEFQAQDLVHAWEIDVATSIECL